MGALADDLTGPGIELEETHVSWVFLGPREVWKVKKPVDLGFLDFTTAAKRRRACEAEVRLNRRLAPRVYLGVVPVVRDADGRHRFGDGAAGAADAVDWAVHMTRLDDRDRGDRRLAADRLDVAATERIAEHVAAFHDRAARDERAARYGTPAAIRRNVEENFAQTRGVLDRFLSPAEAAEIEAWQLGFLDRERARFEARIEAGRVRDGHGDLRLEHVYLEPRDDDAPAVTIIDCIEFNERFRFADVCADVAFLAMDLGWHGRVDLAERFLAAYARAANDYDLYPLVDFYESYRAFVRGKVASIRFADPALEHPLRERAAAEARRYFRLALASERRALLPPMVVAVGGLIGAGKSTTAAALGAELGAPVVDSDRTRKHLLGVEPEAPVRPAAWRGGYAPAVTERVYAELLRRADAVLRSGRPVVLDASFRGRAQRAAARELALAHRVAFRFVECRAARAVLLPRLERRAREGGVSDGRVAIFDDFVARWQAVDELPAAEHLRIDAARPLEENLAELRQAITTWPAGMRA